MKFFPKVFQLYNIKKGIIFSDYALFKKTIPNKGQALVDT